MLPRVRVLTEIARTKSQMIPKAQLAGFWPHRLVRYALDAVRSWLAAGGDEFVNEPAQNGEYRRPLDGSVFKN